MARWDHVSRYYGVYKNSVGTEHRGYFAWNKAKGGFVLYINDSVALPTAFKSLGEFRRAGYSFTPTKDMEMEPTV